MAMSPTRTILWVFGVGLLIAGLMLIYFETGVAQWIPSTIAVAGLLIIVGLLVIGFSERAPPGERESVGAGGTTTIHKEETHHP